MDRRQFIKTSIALAGAGLSQTLIAKTHGASESQLIARDLEDLAKYDFIMPRVKFADQGGVSDYWLAKPGGDANLLREFSRVIRCKTKPILNTRDLSPMKASDGQLNAVVTFNEPNRLKNFPFLFMTGESHYRLNKTEENNLKEYLEQGGFIFMDDCFSGKDRFYQSSCNHLGNIFGKGSVRQVPRSHEIYHTVFDMGEIGLPRCWGIWREAYGVFIEDRLAALVSSHDVHCGWCDSQRNSLPRKPGQPGHVGDHTYDDAIHFGINMIMYAMSH